MFDEKIEPIQDKISGIMDSLNNLQKLSKNKDFNEYLNQAVDNLDDALSNLAEAQEVEEEEVEEKD